LVAYHTSFFEIWQASKYTYTPCPVFGERVRFVPSTELIWVASKSKDYYFDYNIAKKLTRLSPLTFDISLN
jgi:hypothetical protein